MCFCAKLLQLYVYTKNNMDIFFLQYLILTVGIAVTLGLL